MTVLNDPSQLFTSFKTKVVEFPEADGKPAFSVKLRELTADEWAVARKDGKDPRPEFDFEAMVIYAGAVKEDGSPLFASVEAVKKLPRHLVDKLGDELGILMGLWTPPAEAAEEALKNSDATRTSDSDTSSD